MPPSPLPKRTRLLVDRLSRRAHAFHRFAHHPLCGRYASELIPLGRKARLCRGCSYAALGALSGALGAFWLRPTLATLALGTVLGAGLLLTSLTRRLPKSLGRGLACSAATFAGVGGLFSEHAAARALAAALVLLGGLFLWRYRQRQPHRAPCETCPERLGPAVCSGLRPIVQRERAFRRLAQRYVDQAVTSRS
jgi:hypothetical protein